MIIKYTILVVLVFGFILTAKAESLPTFLDSNKTIRVENVQDCKECSGGKKFTVKARGKKKGEYVSVEIANATSMLKSARRYQSLISFIGVLPYGGDVVTIFDMERKKIVDVIYGYDVSFSENSRYFIFKQFYPRFSPEQYQKAIVKIYDLNRSVIENRVSQAVDTANPEFAGKPIFPLNLSEADSLTTKSGVMDFSLENTVVWKSDWLAFVAPDNDEYFSLVIYSLNNKENSACVVPIIPAFGRHRDIRFSVESLTFLDGKLVMNIYENNGISGNFLITPSIVCKKVR
jgi:hypothetical protein